jgi:flavin reductase (DIM6/NTAB) family NADH-FMN oxidoreductase RutF
MRIGARDYPAPQGAALIASSPYRRRMSLEPESLNTVLWSIPNVLCLIGSASGDESNGMTASWVTQVAMDPVLVGVSVDATAVTHRLIASGGAFTVNLWDRADTRVFVKFSKPAEAGDGTLNGRPVRRGVTGAPIFIEAVAYLDCRLHTTVPLGSHTLFIGEVVDCGFGEGGRDKPVARMEDTRMKYGGILRGH